jgi:RimJ/RimL family protein N-acetyltransferase
MNVRIELQMPAHADGLFTALQDERIYTFLDDEPPVSVEALKARIGRLLAGATDGSGEKWLNWTVFERDQVVGYTQSTIHPDGTASLAYVLSPSVWGRSIGYSASLLTLEKLNAMPEVTNIVADTETGNERSKALLARLGFSFSHEKDGEVFYRLN